jgi:hypothetical protein
MNKFIADIFSTLLKLLHVLVAIAIVFLVVSGVGSGNSLILIYAVVACVVYVVVVGFLSVVLSMHENIASILKILESNTNQSKPVDDSIVKSVVSSNIRLEPKI